MKTEINLYPAFSIGESLIHYYLEVGTVALYCSVVQGLSCLHQMQGWCSKNERTDGRMTTTWTHVPPPLGSSSKLRPERRWLIGHTLCKPQSTTTRQALTLEPSREEEQCPSQRRDLLYKQNRRPMYWHFPPPMHRWGMDPEHTSDAVLQCLQFKGSIGSFCLPFTKHTHTYTYIFPSAIAFAPVAHFLLTSLPLPEPFCAVCKHSRHVFPSPATSWCVCGGV